MIRLLLLLSLSAAPAVFADAVTLTMEDWARPRSGENLTQHPQLMRAVRAFDAEPGQVIAIAHGTGEAGQLWAEELRSWLVALGVSSARIRFEARPELQGTLMINIQSGGS